MLNKPEIKHIEGVDRVRRRAARGDGQAVAGRRRTPSSRSAITVSLWIFPGIVALIVGNDSDIYTAVSDRLDEGIVAVFGASLLFLLPTDWQKREFTLHWSDAAEIDWGTIVLFGTGIIFGSLLADTGLAETIGTSVADALGLTSVSPITIFAVLLAIVVSETTSNTASAAVVVPIIIPIAVAAGINPFVPALAATFAASFGFMLPVSTPQNAIVYGSGRGADHHDDPVRHHLRHPRRDPDHRVPAADGRGAGARVVTAQKIAVIPGDGIGGEVIDGRPRGPGRGVRQARDLAVLHRVRLVLRALRQARAR